MNNPAKIYDRLIELQARLEHTTGFDYDLVEEVIRKLYLYNKEYFENSSYSDILSNLDLDNDYVMSIKKLKGVIAAMIDEIDLKPDESTILKSEIEAKIKRLEEENNEIRKRQAEAENSLRQAHLEKQKINHERRLLDEQNVEFKRLQDDLNKERESLIAESAKFDEFKKKLEVSGKTIDFQTLAKHNRHIAIGWAILGGILIISLLVSLSNSLSQPDSFSSIANSVHDTFNVVDTLRVNASDTVTTANSLSAVQTPSARGLEMNILSNISKETIQQTYKTTLYFSFIKYSVTKLLIYSLWIYGIVLSIKNYNAQMHNHVINAHKSNSLRSTLSLLDTARSDDGNDKLLLQATQAIFAHQNTGYNGQDSETASPNLVTNVIDSVSKKI